MAWWVTLAHHGCCEELCKAGTASKRCSLQDVIGLSQTCLTMQQLPYTADIQQNQQGGQFGYSATNFVCVFDTARPLVFVLLLLTGG